MMEAVLSPRTSPTPISEAVPAREAGDKGAQRPRAGLRLDKKSGRILPPPLPSEEQWKKEEEERELAREARAKLPRLPSPVPYDPRRAYADVAEWSSLDALAKEGAQQAELARYLHERDEGARRIEEREAARAARFAAEAAALEGAGRAALANPTKDVSAKRRAEGTKAAEDRRRQRFALREALSSLSRVSRVAACGRRRVSKDSGRLVRVDGDGSAHYANTQMCGSVWLCPVCSAKVRQHRAEEIKKILSKHLKEMGGGAYFGMMTFPHSFGDKAKNAVDTCAQAFRAVLAGRAYAADRKRFGIVGTIRSMEVTHGPNGFHPHVHPVFLTERPLSDEELADLRASIFGRWSQAVQARGYREPLAAFCTLSPIRSEEDVGDYLAKVEGVDRRVSLEVARSDLKRGRETRSRGEGELRHRTMWEVLEGAASGDVQDWFIWMEYEQAVQRRQAITFSNGLRARYGLVEEQSDEEAAELEQKRPAVTVYEIEDDAWYALTRTRGGMAYVLEMAERGMGPREIAAFLVECVERVYGDEDKAPLRQWGARRTVRDAQTRPAAARKHNFFAAV